MLGQELRNCPAVTVPSPTLGRVAAHAELSMLLPSLGAICQGVEGGIRERTDRWTWTTSPSTGLGQGPQRKAHLGATTGGGEG